jgi:hypothetical protein
MKRASFLAYFILLFAVALAHGPRSFGSNPGVPGCLHEVQASPMNDAMAKKFLTKPCQEFRKNYFKTLAQYIKNPKALTEDLAHELVSKKSLKNEVTPYNAILFSLLTHDQALIPELSKRAAAEKKNKTFYQFGAAALERMNEGRCNSFSGPMYEEICNAKDAAFTRVALLKQSEGKRK